MAEVHIIGQIIQAKDFPKQNLFCKWSLQIGNNWKIISGKKEGQTQVTSSQLLLDFKKFY
ncbi:B9 domain-containing protein 2 [Asbolus verrucosus]|uniref:B9 domain-containing protein 2 n=1 Tax=Asbolus verrucosus TaxID=1661398 RepID=A0A482W127_ASBVE|nr:B9 domain-containing protein 2 [Asbolus verrucosus]